MTHGELCLVALRWLKGHRRCYPVFANCASCSEIPDAIGWSSRWEWHGSTVVEVKTSRADFVRDRHKGKLRMGDFRFFLCEPNVVTVVDVEKYFPDHGLLYFDGRRVKKIRLGWQRVKPDHRSEIRFLRYAIINRKQSWQAGELALGLPTPDPGESR